MPPLGIFGKFFGRTVSEGAAFAAGVALGPVLGPVVQEEKNAVNARYPFKPLEPGDAAGIVAEDVELEGWGVTEASYHGVDADRFKALYSQALNAPGIALLFEAWRRNLIGDGDFAHGLRKAKLEPRWDGPLRKLRDVLLSSEELAMLQQQGFVDESRANAEGELQGVTSERQQLRFEASGLPPGFETALEMLRRQIIDDATFAQIVREGHTKTKYTDDLLRLRDRVLSAATYATLRLKGWITAEESHAGGALTGYTADQMDLLFREHGRPATTHQVWIGLQRGGKYLGAHLSERETFDRAIIQSDIRPEWADILWAQRYTYPSAFVLRALTQSGDIPQAQTEQILKYEGWEPELAAQVAARWATAKAGTAKEATAADLLALYDGEKATLAETLAALEALGYPADEAQAKVDVLAARRVSSARSAATADLHTAFKKGEVLAPAATAALERLDVDADTAAQIVAYWQAYRDAFPPAAPVVPPPVPPVA